MYSGEYDACDVSLSVYPHLASLKNMPGHGGNRTYDLWNIFLFRNITYSNRSDHVAQLVEHWANVPKVVGSIPTVARHIFKLARCGYTLRVTSQASYSPEYIAPTQKKS